MFWTVPVKEFMFFVWQNYEENRAENVVQKLFISTTMHEINSNSIAIIYKRSYYFTS